MDELIDGSTDGTVDWSIDQSIVEWMDEDWMHNFFDFIRRHKFQLSGMNHMQKKIKLTFVTAKECTMFGLKYDKEQQNDIFNNRLQ